MALSDKARKVLAGVRKGRDVKNAKRDFHGRFSKVEGRGQRALPAPKLKIDATAQQIFTQMTAEGKTKAQIIAAMEAQGIPNAKGQYGSLLREKLIADGKRLRTRIRAKKTVGTLVTNNTTTPVPLPPVIPKAVVAGSALEVARTAYKTGGWSGAAAAVERHLHELERSGKLVPEMQAWHGMDPEKMVSTEFIDHTRIHWVPGDTRVAAAGRRKVGEFMATHVTDPMPPELYKGTDDIYLAVSRNSGDAYWAKKWGDPTVRAAATGGAYGKVVFYNIGAAETTGDYGTLVHELGHSVAKYVYGDPDPPSDSAFTRLWRAGIYSSRYGANNEAEALAEAVRRTLYGSRPGSSRDDNPLSVEYKEAVMDLLRQARERGAYKPSRWAQVGLTTRKRRRK